MKRITLVLLAVMSLLLAACGASGDGNEGADEEGGNATETTEAGGSGTTEFGTLESPCGEDIDGTKVTVKADEAGKGADKLYLGVRNDRGSTIRPGLLAEMYDASVAFAAWCNEQGGIGGLPIEVVDLDGKLLEVETAMATACTGVFAMVGGGNAQDTLMFSGKDGSDFHKCKLIDFAGFAVSTELTEANGVVQALPNPAYSKPDQFHRDLVELYPEEMKKTTIVWGQLDSLRANRDQMIAVGETVEGFGSIDPIAYDAIGAQDYNILAQQVKDSGATAVGFIGEPSNFSRLSQKLKEQDWEGVLFADANQYDDLALTTSGPEAVEGIKVRVAFHPFEEAGDWPATEQLVEILEEHGPSNVKIASLSNQSFSAWLLFATAAKQCAEESGGELSRDCVMEAGLSIEDWDAGGLHATSHPGEKQGPECAMIVTVENGTWKRLHPAEVDGDDDDGEGFSCGEIVEIEGDFGEGNVDPSRNF
jgi:hypothetical protein